MDETDEAGSSLAYQYSQSPSYSERPYLKTQDKEKQDDPGCQTLAYIHTCTHTYLGAH